MYVFSKIIIIIIIIIIIKTATYSKGDIFLSVSRTTRIADKARRAEESHLDKRVWLQETPIWSRVALRKELILYAWLDLKANIYTDCWHLWEVPRATLFVDQKSDGKWPRKAPRHFVLG